MYALIEKATNKIIRMSDVYTPLAEAKPFKWVECPDGVYPSWSYDGATFTPPYEPPPAPYVPEVVSMRQARLALLQQNLLDTVNATINAVGGADLIEWEYATEVRRDSPLVSNMAGALQISDTDLDNLFTLAATL